jgi:hypothetical protein
MTGDGDLEMEWTRIELLIRSLIAARDGRQVEPSVLDQIAAAQQAVTAGRADGTWSGVAGLELDDLERDVLAAALAPEAKPTIGWLFAQLQAGAPQQYATPALLQDLLVLDGSETRELYARLTDTAKLRTAGLIEAIDDGPYSPLRPTARARTLLLGWTETATPPGARRVRDHAGWQDLVLPPDRLTVLREYLALIRHREFVAQDWGGRVGGGPVALFCGASGTGKTYAATVIAGELGWPLYRVDLGRLVSKYIGETEKNLNRLFEAAHGRPLILQFDEADSLFGKRGEIRDARDRYANLEVSHLLARIEQHCGPCILTTNMRRHLDAAFTRRFQVVVEFPRPDAPARAEIWARLLPPRAPRDPELNIETLAGAAMTGGAIHNAAIHAAILAADAGCAIGPREAAIAVWRELGKDGREVAPSALGKLAPHLPASVVCGAELMSA